MSKTIIATVMQLSDRLFSLANRILRDREVALDTVQELCLKVIEQPKRYRDARNLKSYLMRSVLNMALNHKRDKKQQADPIGEAAVADNSFNPELIYGQTQKETALMEALDQLPKRQNEAIMLRFFLGHQISEAANTMGISESSVKVHLTRGLQSLRKSLGRTIGKETI